MLACVAVLASSASAAPVDPFTMGNPAFCTPKEPVRDFGISTLPHVAEVPETGAALGHGALQIYGGYTRVTSRPESFGYGFGEDRFPGSVWLDWTVTAELWTVDRQGHEIQEVDRGEVRIGRLTGANHPRIYLDPPKNRRGFYRFDIQFTNRRGREVGLYGSYFKVVRPFWNVKLGLSRQTAHPGRRILSRVENFGTERLTYGEYFSVERLRGGRWRPEPGLVPNFWLAWAGELQAGGSGRCSVLTLPASAPRGRYRLVKDVGSITGFRPRSAKPHRLIAPFTVVG
jgi:hypothetical protein